MEHSISFVKEKGIFRLNNDLGIPGQTFTNKDSLLQSIEQLLKTYNVVGKEGYKDILLEELLKRVESYAKR